VTKIIRALDAHQSAPSARSRRAFGAIGPRAHSACTLLGLRQLSPAPRGFAPRSQARELAQQGMPRARAGGGIMARKRGVSVDIADMKEVWHASARVCRTLARDSVGFEGCTNQQEIRLHAE